MKHLIKKLLNEESRKITLLEELSLLIEKEISVGPALKKKLGNINKPFADKLLKFLTSDKISDKVTIDTIDYNLDDDKTITGYFKDREGKRKARKFKVGKLLKYLGVNPSEYKGYEIEELISYLKQGSLEDFKVVDGEDILKAYHCDNYDEGETMGSCMRYEAAQTYLKMYVDNPDDVKCLVLLNPNNNKVRGRALLWHMDNDRWFMDRVYMINSQYRNLFNLYKEKNNFSMIPKTVTLTNGGEYDKYPYMDTFEFYSPSNGELSTEDYHDDSIMLTDTQGGYSEGGAYIEYGEHEGETIDEDDAVFLSYRKPNENVEGYAHEDDVETIDGTAYLKDDCIELYNGDFAFKYDDYSYPVELTHGAYEGEYAKLDDTVQLEDGQYGSDSYITTDDDYIELDNSIYDTPYAFTDDTTQTYSDKIILRDDAITLYEPHYGDFNYAHPDEATEVDIKDHGSAWVLDDDLDEFEENGLIEEKLEAIMENKSLIKKLLREGLDKVNSFESLLGEVTSKLDFSSFKMNDTLNPEIWVDENTIKPEIQENLIKIAEDYYNNLELDIPILDITLTGSLANYNWSKYSDVDLHIIFDANELGDNKDMVKDLLDVKTRAWNLKHNITVKGFDVELYLQPEDQPHHSTGVYSLMNKEWVDKPEMVKPEIDKETITKKYNNIISIVKDIEDDKDNQNVIEKIEQLKDKIKDMRKSGLEDKGEYSSENITFKLLRRNDIMQKLDDLLVNAYDDEHTIVEVSKFPIADPPMYGDSNYKDRNGIIVDMKPQDYLYLVPHLELDDDSEDNIEDLASMMRDGVEIDPPTLYLDGNRVDNHDGRHRVYAAMRLGLNRIPVLFLDKNNNKPQLKGLKKQLG